LFIRIILNYILGYVRISVEGYYIERFINICRSKKILLWNMKREKASILYINIGINEFRKIREIAKKTNCRINIKEKKGIPFFLNRYKKRKFFLIFLLIIILSIIIMSNFIWNIELIGAQNINSEEFIENLKNSGLSIGKYKGSIDSKKIIDDTRLSREDLTWMGIKIKGTNAIVEIVEANERPEIVDEMDFCNIVSNKDAEIVKINANNGTSLVNPGDIIKKGTILIGGWMEGKYTGIRYVHSSGEIKAKVWYSAREKMNYKQLEMERTGKSEKKHTIFINNFKINLYKKLSNFESYDTMYLTKKVKIFSNFYLPVGLIECNNFETIEKEVIYNKEEVKEILLKQVEEKILQEIENKELIQDKKISFYEDDEEYIEVEVTYEVLENIGTKEKIVF